MMKKQLRLQRLAVVSLILLGAGLSACSKKGTEAEATASLLLAREDLRTLGLADHASGPVVTGTIEPERRADLRAEVSALVQQVYKENGEPVHRGDLLVRLDDTSIRDSLNSAEESARAAAQTLEQAERQLQRQKTLQASGMTSMQALEDAENRRNTAQSDLVAAHARTASARQQLQRTEVRAPFDGVVSERRVSAGDTAQIGKELVKVIDPSSLRLEGSVSADRLQELKLGQSVSFRVNGYPQDSFVGHLRRIDVAANAVTRQVAVLVALDGDKKPRAAGLYAEGIVETQSMPALMLGEGAIVKEGDKAFVWRVAARKLQKVEIKLGDRDHRLGEYVLLGGVKAGDQVLRHPGSALVDGQTADMAQAVANGASAASSAGGSSAAEVAGR